MASEERNGYDDTINTSKEASMAKAIEIMLKDIENNQVKQVIVRPKVSLLKGLLLILLFIASYVGLLILSLNLLSENSTYRNIAVIGITVVWVIIALLCMKRFLIWLVLLYQKYAPDNIRKQCFFEPSCSEYMKLAIEKYGVIRGVKKGLCRIWRCRWPNGGVDYP
jgi:putative component of membrane protein insertase Oxa1/YidC/SpoIIIJ protein YidD